MTTTDQRPLAALEYLTAFTLVIAVITASWILTIAAARLALHAASALIP